ncbi:hypothetical protein Moror_12817 [Moniliophthora roreri MCA 2997]|uniref:Uncharacterized protein n=2 Tax=Moniliophthora roreri TaxID=221103 RepID=V2XK16_MONRO|nr:hypothetical protein Moror_12817 [Moniliophthora roreri MCA 2997]KAI3611758.1 hypothetical protein WG66_007672 [Moniliophthora roreri]
MSQGGIADPIVLCDRCGDQTRPKATHKPPPVGLLSSEYFPSDEELNDLAEDRRIFDETIARVYSLIEALKDYRKDCVICEKCGFRLAATEVADTESSSDDEYVLVPGDIEFEIVDIDGRIHKKERDRLGSVLNELIQARRKMSFCAEAYAGFTAPIRRFSASLLKRIFLFQRDNDVESRTIALYSTENDIQFPEYLIPSPINLSHVCRLWRNIVYSSPELWNTIIINFNDPYTISDITRMYTEQSGDAPLTVYIIATSRQSHLKITGDVLSVLFEQSHRWRCAFISMAQAPDARQRRFPLLEELDINWVRTSRSLKSWDDCESLRMLTLPSYRLSDSLPLSQLTSLSLTRLSELDSPKLLCAMLRMCNNLEHLFMNWLVAVPYPLSPLKPFSLPLHAAEESFALDKLLTIDVNYNTMQPQVVHLFHQFFHQLIAPNVTSIHLSPRVLPVPIHGIEPQDLREPNIIDKMINVRFHNWPHEGFLVFLGNTRGSVRSLELAGIQMDDEYLISVLRLTPNIEELTIFEALSVGQSLWTPRFLDWLSSTAFIPNLTSFHVALESSFHDFVTFQSGIRIVHLLVGLKKLSLSCREALVGHIPDTVWERLRRLVVDGIVVELNGDKILGIGDD